MADWYSGDVISNGIRLHYTRTGGPEGNGKPPFVLSHGFTDNGLCWSRVARVLEAEYDIIMVDARNHGLSERPLSGHGSGDQAGDLSGLIEALGLGRPALMGHSMGANSTALCAADYPDVVACAILEDPPWRLPSPDAAVNPARPAMGDWIQSLAASTVEEILAQGKQSNPTWDDEEFPAWVQSKKQINPAIGLASRGAVRPWQEWVAQIACPTLILRADAEKGAIVTPQVAGMLVDLNPRLEPVHIAGAGHNIRREQFGAFVTGVREFLSRHYPGAE